MIRFRQRWMAWVLAAVLPVSGVVSAASAPSMALATAAVHAPLVAATAAVEDPMRGCHASTDLTAAADPDPGGPCCDTAACTCVCVVSLTALIADPALMPIVPHAARSHLSAGVQPTAPSNHPFRPPIA